MTTQSERELLPCPFCGKRPSAYDDGEDCICACMNSECHALPGCVGNATVEEAIAAWNRRATPAQPEAAQEPNFWTVRASHDNSLCNPYDNPSDAEAYAEEKRITHPSVKWDVLPLYTRPAEGWRLVPVDVIQAAANKLALIGKIYDGDKESRRLSTTLAECASAPQPKGGERE